MYFVFAPELSHDLPVQDGHGRQGDQEHQHGQAGSVGPPLPLAWPDFQTTGVVDIEQEVIFHLDRGNSLCEPFILLSCFLKKV